MPVNFGVIGEMHDIVFDQLLKGELGSLEDTFTDEADIEELLRDDEKIVEVKAREHIAGYPTRPLYREIGQQLSQWLLTG